MSEVYTEVAGRALTLTNLDKVLYPAVGFTKAEVIDYYLRIAPAMLPHLADRVITRLRFPDGVDRQPFYEKNAPKGLPSWVRTCRAHGSDSEIDYLVADEVATLVLLANYAALELHTPQWRIPAGADEVRVDGDLPADLVMIDLDPGAGIDGPTMAKAALQLAGRLAADGLVPYPKTSGSKGLQVQAAIEPTPAGEVVDYVRRIAVELEQQHPDRFVVTQNVAQRANKILIDVLQNQAGRNTITAYSLRGKDRPTVSTPITWDEVAAAASGGPALSFTAADAVERVDRHGDLSAELVTGPRAAFPGNP